MRLAILGSRRIPAQYGGFETFTEEVSVRLVRNAYPGYFGLTMNGSGFQLKSVSKGGSAQSWQTIDGFHSFQECSNHKYISYAELKRELAVLFQRSHL